MAVLGVWALAVLLVLGWATANVWTIALPPDATQVLRLSATRKSVLTNDGGVVLLDATIQWRIADAQSYRAARAQITAALQDIFRSAAVFVAAARPLDDFRAPRPALRRDLVAAMNTRLAALTHAGAGLGVEVTGADVTTALPPAAQPGFASNPGTEWDLAAARLDAARMRQQAEQARDARLSQAHASAAERVAGARASIATIVALSGRMDPAARANALAEVYRDRIGPILRRAGSVNAVDAKSVSRLILPGAQ